MSLLKQSPSKNLRSKGFKVKNVLQVCLLLAICIWLLHQVKHSYNRKNVYEKGTATVSELQGEHEGIKFGRKDIRSQTLQTNLEVDRQEEEGEFNTEFDEVEENKIEESEEEGRGGGDNEIDGHDQEKSEEEESEEVEDLIDEADRVEDDSEEQESEGAGSHFEDESLLVNESQHEGEINSQAKEEHYKGEDAAGSREEGQAGLKTLLEIQNWSK